MNVQVGLISTLSQAFSSAVSRLGSLAPWRTEVGFRGDRFIAPSSSPSPSPIDTSGWVAALSARGMDSEAIAVHLNGTSHTAGIRDMRLARKVVSVMTTQNEVLSDPQPALEAKERLRGELQVFLRSGQAFDTAWLLHFLRTIGGPEVDALFADLGNLSYTLEVVPDEDFDAAVPRMSLRGKTGCFESRRDKRLPDRLLVRGLPRLSPLLEDFEERRIEALADRVLVAMHEREHWRHFTGHFERRRRAVFEMMSRLEEHRLLLRVHKFDYLEQAASNGLTLAQYFQSLEPRDTPRWRDLLRIFI